MSVGLLRYKGLALIAKLVRIATRRIRHGPRQTLPVAQGRATSHTCLPGSFLFSQYNIMNYRKEYQ